MKTSNHIINKIKIDNIETILSNNDLYVLYKDKLEENSYRNLYDFYVAKNNNLNNENQYPTQFYLYIGNINTSAVFLEIETLCMYYSTEELTKTSAYFSILSVLNINNYIFKGDNCTGNSYSVLIKNKENTCATEMPVMNRNIELIKYEKSNFLKQGLFK